MSVLEIYNTSVGVLQHCGQKRQKETDFARKGEKREDSGRIGRKKIKKA